LLDRRRFVCTIGSVIAFGFVRWNVGTATAAAGRTLEGPLTREVFVGLVKEPFTLSLEGGRSAELVLLRIDDDPDAPIGTQFTVVFQTDRDVTPVDGTFRLSHGSAGTTALFLQPGEHHDHTWCYRAPFNLLPSATNVQDRPARRVLP
jgi:hypothetical protein